MIDKVKIKNTKIVINLFIILCCFYSIVPLCFAKGEKTADKSGWITEFAKKDVDFSGLDKKKQDIVIEVLNQNDCICGCKKGHLANCLKNDAHCGFSRAIAKEIVQEAGKGKSKEYLEGLIAGYFLYKKEKKEKEDKRVYNIDTSGSPRKGPEAAPITIVEFIDFQCPFCLRAVSVIDQIMKEYPDQVKLYVINNPLKFHKNAQYAAVASLAAQRQGKYWDMYNKLLENFRSLNDKSVLKIAQEIGLDMEKFSKDVTDPLLKKKVLADKKMAQKVGATGTPAFFVNGRKVKGGAQPFPVFKKIIYEELNKLKKKQKK